ncbi:BTB/POZ domain-containing protein 2 [Echinococcus granulosus]|uniref:BTB:POZ domain containing protein 2 n=1 Tax=Echinococcus granulosus TaxID=6210 RepID=A0A068WCR7_ECHGR|nr:BTB/POZ domain-containing protein 2 [Echinococcus granulosus]CDS15462.1 BTB:POZ domain containing protein 2 [Echinococcus granulosus]
MSTENPGYPFLSSADGESPAKNTAAAKNRQRSPSLLNGNFVNSSGLFSSSPLHFDWQSTRSCVSERVRSLFANTTLADVYFNIHYQLGCDGASMPFTHQKSSPNRLTVPTEVMVQRIPAHAFILAISSAVFEAMFYGPLSVQNTGSAVAVPDSLDHKSPKYPRQPMPRQTSLPPSAITSTSQPSEHMHVDSMGDVISSDIVKEEQFQPMIFNPSPSQITPNNPIEVHLDDVNPVAFANVLRFIYTDEIQIDPSNVLQTLYVAKKYAITVMERACVEFLSQAITVDNAFMLLGQANFFDEQELAQKCLEVIDKNTVKVFDTDDFLAADKDLLCSVLERDTLCIREVRLFVSVVNWAKSEYNRRRLEGGLSPSHCLVTCDAVPTDTNVSTILSHPTSVTTLPSLSDVPVEALRTILQPLLPHIRFPQMSIEEFADVVVPSGVLEDSITIKIFQHFIASKTAKPELPFLKRPRCYLHGVEEAVRRFGVVDQRWDYRGTSDRIRFKVDRKIYVVGFGLYGSIHGESEYEVSIEIVHPESGVVLGSNDVTYLSDGSPNTFRVAFQEPIPLTPHVNYLACATIKGQDSYYGTGGRREISHECSAGGKVTFQFSYAACTNNGTSVEDGQIPEIIFFV